MDRIENLCQQFVRRIKMPQVRTRIATTHRTSTFGIERRFISRESRVAYVQFPSRSEYAAGATVAALHSASPRVPRCTVLAARLAALRDSLPEASLPLGETGRYAVYINDEGSAGGAYW